MKTFFAMFFAVVMGGAAVVVGAWSGDNSSPTESISTPEIEPNVISAGGLGEVHYRFQRFRACDRRVLASIIDSAGKRFEYAPTISPPTSGRVPGKVDTYVKPIRVFRNAAAGPAVYHVEIEDSCNPWQKLFPIRRTIEVPFEVAPAEVGIGPLGYRGEGLAQCFMRRFAAAGR